MSPYHASGDMGFESGLSAGGGPDEAHAVWEKKYVFVKKMVPGFVSEEFGKKVCPVSYPVRVVRQGADWSRSSRRDEVLTSFDTVAVIAIGSKHRRNLQMQVEVS